MEDETRIKVWVYVDLIRGQQALAAQGMRVLRLLRTETDPDIRYELKVDLLAKRACAPEAFPFVGRLVGVLVGWALCVGALLLFGMVLLVALWLLSPLLHGLARMLDWFGWW